MFLQEVHGPDGQVRSTKGKWDLSGGILYMRPCLQIGQAGAASADLCGEGVDILGSSIAISLDPDHGLEYQKIR